MRKPGSSVIPERWPSGEAAYVVSVSWIRKASSTAGAFSGVARSTAITKKGLSQKLNTISPSLDQHCDGLLVWRLVIDAVDG